MIFGSINIYSARAQDCPQEMERNEATSKHVAWPSCSWLLLSFFPNPVGHPKHEQCRPYFEHFREQYREGQMEFTPQIEVLFMLFNRCHTKNRKNSFKQTTEFPIPSCREVFRKNFRESPGLRAATAASYCPSRAAQRGTP